MKKGSTYLPGLNGIRAIASVLVLIAHSNKALSGILEIEDLPLSGNGLTGVTMFFVLSGFLITHRLLLESPTGHINIGNFYIRRILRIFPLYYFYLFLTLFITFIARPELIDLTVLPFYIFLCPNIPWIWSMGIPNLHHYWSLGVEEQFYLFWPIIFKLGSQKLLKISTVLFSTFFLIKVYLYSLESNALINSIIYSMGFPNILIGCIGAIIYHKDIDIINWIINCKVYQFLSWLILINFILGGWTGNFFQQEIISFLTLLIIYGQVKISNRIINLDHPVLFFMGKISFGIYVYHPLVISLTKNLMGPYHLSLGGLGFSIFFYLIILIVTLSVSYVSYQHFEKKFLYQKSSYS